MEKIEQVPIVDAALAYNCLFQAKTYILIVRNALHVPDIAVNVLPPFIIREAGLQINECPKIQSSDPTVEVHSMYSDEADLRIHFDLKNTFSYFATGKPTNDELNSCDKLFVTPDYISWDPHNEHFSENEAKMMGPEGNIIQVDERTTYMVEDHEVVLGYN